MRLLCLVPESCVWHDAAVQSVYNSCFTYPPTRPRKSCAKSSVSAFVTSSTKLLLSLSKLPGNSLAIPYHCTPPPEITGMHSESRVRGSDVIHDHMGCVSNASVVIWSQLTQGLSLVSQSDGYCTTIARRLLLFLIILPTRNNHHICSHPGRRWK